MRTLDRNKQVIYYSNYKGKTINAYGEMVDDYTRPVKAKAHVSVPLTDVTISTEGTRPTYDKVLIADKTLDVDEHTIFYVDKLPNLTDWDEGDYGEYDYIATRVQYSLNSLRVELTKVEK